MAKIEKPLSSTDQIAPTKFRPHGKVVYDPQGRMLVTTATGPFNGELVTALRELALLHFPNMALLGPWGQCVYFQESTMGGPEVFSGLTDLLIELSQLNIAPTATAFVLPPEVEGAALMTPLWENCYRAAKLSFAVFEKGDDATAWIASYLQPQ